MGPARPSFSAFSQSLKHELADKNIRIQAVLPGATATEFWGIAGTPVEHLPTEIVHVGGRYGGCSPCRFRSGRTRDHPGS